MLKPDYGPRASSWRSLGAAAILALVALSVAAQPGTITNFQTTAGASAITLTWNGDATGIGVWNIERSEQGLAPGSPPATPFRLTVQTGAGGPPGVQPFRYTDSSVQPNRRYCYRLQAQRVNGIRLPPTTPVCLDFQAAPSPTPPPVLLLLTIVRPMGGQTLLVNQPIQIQWNAVLSSFPLRYTVRFERTSPLSSTIVPGGPFTGTSVSWNAQSYPAARGPGRIFVSALDPWNRIVATGSVSVILRDPLPGGGTGGGTGPQCSTDTTLSYHAGGGSRFGWYAAASAGTKTFTVQLTGGWKHHGIRFRISPGDGLAQYTCTAFPTVHLRNLNSMGYSTNVENGKHQSDGSVLAETDDVGINAYFKQNSGTVFLDVKWPQNDWTTCPAPQPCSCIYLEMRVLP